MHVITTNEIAIRLGTTGSPITHRIRMLDDFSRDTRSTQAVVDVAEETPTVVEAVLMGGFVGDSIDFEDRSLLAIRVGDVPP